VSIAEKKEQKRRSRKEGAEKKEQKRRSRKEGAEWLMRQGSTSTKEQ
jgi:hypothetical protein